MLSQHVNVTFPFTVEEIVHMGAGDSGRALAQRFVDTALHEVGLNDFRQRQLPTLSGGQHTISAVWSDSHNSAGYGSATATIKIDVSLPSS